MISAADTPKPEAAETMMQLRELGLEPILLTGDAPQGCAGGRLAGRHLGR